MIPSNRNTWNNVCTVDMGTRFNLIIIISSLLLFVIVILCPILRDTKVTDLLLKINYEITAEAMFLLVSLQSPL